MDDREGLKAGSTLVKVSDSPAKDAKCLITYHTDDAVKADQAEIVVFNSRSKAAPRLLQYKGRDFIRSSVSDPQKDYSPKLGDLAFVTHSKDLLEREAKRRINAADGTKGEFKGDAMALEELMNRLVSHIKKEDKPVLVPFEPGTHELG